MSVAPRRSPDEYNNPAVLVMPFGKHQGEAIADLPTNYLQWVYDNLDVEGRFTEAMFEAVEDELAKR